MSYLTLSARGTPNDTTRPLPGLRTIAASRGVSPPFSGSSSLAQETQRLP